MDGGRTIRIAPVPGWQAGESYRLVLTPALADASGNAWGQQLELTFQVAASRTLSTFQLPTVRAVEQLGSLLFVAAGEDGLVVVDASDPANLRNAVEGDVRFPFPLADPVSALAVDPHGRVLVAGGGVNGFGQLKIFDPQLFDPVAIAANPTDPAVRYAAFRGSTVVSDSPATGTSLPEGQPRQLAVLSDDDKSTWRIGVDEPPAGIVLAPATPPADGEWVLTLSGTDGTAGQPVTVKNLTRGRWRRSDADAIGAWSVTIPVLPGDRVEVLRNRQTLAYLATFGVGIQLVDVNAFYGEASEDWSNPDPISDVVGEYTGFGDPALRLCNEAISDVGTSLIDLGTLFGDPAHPLTVVGLVAFRGLGMFESDPGDVGNLSFYGDACARLGGVAHVFGLDVAEDYPFDTNLNGRFDPEEYRDYVVVTHRSQGVLVFDATDRENLELAGHVRLGGQAERVTVDRDRRRLFVSAAGGGLYVVDFDRPPSAALLDANGDLTDDRVLEVIALPGNTNSRSFVLPDLGLVFTGGLERGLTGISFDEPRVAVVVDAGSALATGQPGDRFRGTSSLAPLGVPTAPESSDEGAPDRAASFRIVAALPAVVGDEVRLDVVSLGPGGVPIEGAGDSALLPGLPPPALVGAEGVLLRRLATSPWEDGRQLFLSEPVVAVADLRAARDYARTSLENQQCRRCDHTALGIDPSARQILSGHRIAVRFPADLRAALGGTYEPRVLDLAEVSVESVPWEMAPAVRQEPALNPSLGTGDVVPGTLLHSGEFSRDEVDLTVKGRADFDFVFRRTYRSQTVGSGPLGPGWDHGYNQRLRELPNGDVEYYDGRGRREIFAKKAGVDGGYEAPTGYFVELSRTSTGWVWIGPHKGQMRFDHFGRLVSVADAVKDAEDTGNEMRFDYDLAGRLVLVTDALDRDYQIEYDQDGRLASLSDFEGREVRYEYDVAGRLARVLSPEVGAGIETPGRLSTTYAYGAASGDLASQVAQRDNLISITDARGIEWLTLTYADASGDGRVDEVTSPTWGGDPLSITYDFIGRTATVTDRRSSAWLYEHDADGHPTKVTDPSAAVTVFAFNAEGLMTSHTTPSGRLTLMTYPTAGERRSRGNATRIEVRAGVGGPNGSSTSLVTTTTYDTRTNLPETVAGPRGGVTRYTRTQTGLPTTIERPEGATTMFEYNAFGQVTQVTNPNGHVTDFAYFATGTSKGYLRSEVIDPGGLGLTTRYETDPRGNVAAVIDARGTRHTTRYNELDWVVEENAAAGSLDYTTTTIYDAVGQVTEVREPYGVGGETASTSTTYGPLGEVLSTSRAVQPTGTVVTTSTEYDANRNPIRMIDPNGNETAIVYDERNLATSRTWAEGTPVAVAESFTYDIAGRLTARTDGRGNVWSRQYDGYGRLAATEDPLGHRTETSYDDGGNATESRALGVGGVLLARSGASYDLLGRVTSQTRDLWSNDPGTARTLVTTTIYDPSGNVRSVTDPLGRVTTSSYDAAERMTSTTDPVGNLTSYQLDPGGSPEQVMLTEVLPDGDQSATSVSHELDALGRRVATTDPLGNTTRWVLDAAGRVRLVTDPEGHSTERVYDSFGRMLSETLPEGVRVEMAYDAKGNRIGYTDALGNTTAWAYDALDRVEQVAYADGTTESTAYDASGNATQVTQPSGTVVVQSYDPANRLTGRTITAAVGVESVTSESYSYDGLDRLIMATSGGITSTRSYDSLSRLTAETTAGRSVVYELDDAGDVTGILYPSGVSVTRQLDSLGRLESIPVVASYSYRGPDLVAEKTVGALSFTRNFDGARRSVRQVISNPLGWNVFDEQLAWSPRSLKTGTRRGDTGEGLVLAHDGAGRLVQAERTASLPPNNSAPAVGALTSGHGYTYDAAQNLLSQRDAHSGIETVTDLPLDGSGRNRPGQIDGTQLAWDAQGNLAEKGNLRFHYDYRNRLTRVTDSAGTDVVSYTYDAFNRRLSRTAGGVTEETAWAGWQQLERYRAGQLAERRTYGAGLDEIVRIESDLDGDGALEQSYTPVFDQTGNLALAADFSTARVIERYRLSPYGERSILVDLTPPAVEQFRIHSGTLWLEISESANAEALQMALAAGAVTLTETSTNAEVMLNASQPVQEGGQAFRRIVLTPHPTPTDGTTLELRVQSSALVDSFGNQSLEAYLQSFEWPATDAVVNDTTAPVVAAVRLINRFVEIELSEEPDVATVETAVTVDGVQLTWILGADRYTVRSSAPLDAGAATLTIGTALADLAGVGLAESWDGSIPAVALNVELFKAPNPRLVERSTTANRAGFQGLNHDPDTGLVYVRNRWLDPEIGRFVQPDPLAYLDGPSPYQYGNNNPFNYSDPLGLYVVGGSRELLAFKKILVAVGERDLARQLRLRERKIPARYSGWFWEPDTETRIELEDEGADWTGRSEVALLLRSAIDTGVRIELLISDSDPHASGAKTVHQKGGLFTFKPNRPDAENMISIEISPKGIEDTRVPGPGYSIPVPLEAAVVHELGHAYFLYGLRGVRGAFGVGKEETNRTAVQWENIYRRLVGLVERTAHN